MEEGIYMSQEERLRLSVEAKWKDMDTPGYEATLDPDEADEMGAFREDALSYEDAREAAFDPSSLGA